MIPHTRPFLTANHEQALLNQFRTGMINEGQAGLNLIKKLSETFGHSDGILLSTGTQALAVAVRAIADYKSIRHPKVLISDYSCRCIWDSVCNAQGIPVLCDSDYQDMGLYMEDIFYIVQKENINIIIAPHMFGLPSDIEKLAPTGLPIIEDCAHTPGAACNGRRTGNFYEMSVYSFEGSKMLPAGEGGSIMANDETYAKLLNDVKAGTNSFSFQSRMSDLVSSIAAVQCDMYDEIVLQRKEIGRFYRKHLEEPEKQGKLRNPPEIKAREHLYYRYIIRVSPKEIDQIIHQANRSGIMLRRPINTGPLSLKFGKETFRNSVAIHNESVSLPIYPGLEKKDLITVVEFLTQYDWTYSYEPFEF